MQKGTLLAYICVTATVDVVHLRCLLTRACEVAEALKRRVAADRKAAEIASKRLLDRVGAGMAQEAVSNA